VLPALPSSNGRESEAFSDMMPVRLRGHHFLCILTYRGYGYTPAFVRNMTEIVAQIEKGRPVELIEGPDDICDGLTPECRELCDHDCARQSTFEMDLLASDAAKQLLPLHSGEPLILDRDHIALMRQGFADGSLRAACARCSWKNFCTEIVGEGFSRVKLFTPENG
jgi:hypothetical protein